MLGLGHRKDGKDKWGWRKLCPEKGTGGSGPSLLNPGKRCRKLPFKKL